jgi:hypothetical protein
VHEHTEGIIGVFSKRATALVARLFVQTQRFGLTRPCLKMELVATHSDGLGLKKPQNLLGHALATAFGMHIHALELTVLRVEDNSAATYGKTRCISSDDEQDLILLERSKIKRVPTFWG